MKYEFDTTVGEGSVIVTVVMEYEQDEEGTYNENISDVIYEKISLMGIFTAEQYKDLEIEGSMRLSKHLLDEADHAKTVDYDMRCV
jgi:IMP cyclohydrolase